MRYDATALVADIGVVFNGTLGEEGFLGILNFVKQRVAVCNAVFVGGNVRLDGVQFFFREYHGIGLRHAL